MKTYRQHVISDGKKWVVVFLAILLIVVAITCYVTDGFTNFNPYCWFGHNYNENGICTNCGYQIEHNYQLKYDQDNHWEECSVCHDIKEDSTVPHEFVFQSNSTHHYKQCSVCGYIDETSRSDHNYVDGKCECGAIEIVEDSTTYYFYNKDGWKNVYAYAWTEETVAITPQIGDYVLMGNLLGDETQWTAEGSVKLFYNELTHEYVFEGLKLTAGMQFKIVFLDDVNLYFNTIEQGVDNSLYSYSDDGNIVISQDGIYNFYFKVDSNELYFATGTKEKAPNTEIVSDVVTSDWPGDLMTAVPNHDGWYSVKLDNAHKLIFTDNVGNQTDNIIIDTENHYFNGEQWVSDFDN